MIADAIKLVGLNTTPTLTASLYYSHNDHLGTPQVITDQSQAIVWQADYQPFGTVSESVTILANNLRFAGQYFDEESGLHYNYFRDYDPTTGRYIESDPIGLAGGLNTYAYVEGNPVRYLDPTGEVIPLVLGASGVQALVDALIVSSALSVKLGGWPGSTTRDDPDEAGKDAAEEIREEEPDCDPDNPDCSKILRICTNKCIIKGAQGYGGNLVEWQWKCVNACTASFDCGNVVLR